MFVRSECVCACVCCRVFVCVVCVICFQFSLYLSHEGKLIEGEGAPQVLDACVGEPIMDPVLDVCVREPIMDPVQNIHATFGIKHT